MKVLFSTTFLLLIASSLACDVAQKCDPDKCEGPNCICFASEPKDIPIEDRPQIVYLTFDDAFTDLAMTRFYDKIFTGRDSIKNPNGDPIRATHFITHLYNDYSDAHKYYSKYGHEMASHSITHRDNKTYWEKLSESGWKAEMQGLKEMLVKYGGMNAEDIVGARAPFLINGGDRMIDALKSANFEYDCSLPSRAYGYLNIQNGIWPYTMDYKSDLDCQVKPCPTCAHPGFWIQPMLDLEDERIGLDPNNPDAGQPCSMLDACVIPEDKGKSPEVVKNMLLKSFDKSYHGNTRAPFGVYMHAAWFYGQEWHYDGYYEFLKTITDQSQYQDVWIVPVKAGIEYMKNPVPKDELDTFEPFLYDEAKFPKFNCRSTKRCRYTDVKLPGFEAPEIYMKICGSTCPVNYPFLNNVNGDSVNIE